MIYNDTDPDTIYGACVLTTATMLLLHRSLRKKKYRPLEASSARSRRLIPKYDLDHFMVCPPARHVPHRASRNVQVANVCPLWHFVSRRKSHREFPIADLHTIMQSTDFRTKSDMTRTPRCRFVRFALYTCRPVGRRCGMSHTSRRRYVARIDTRRTQRTFPRANGTQRCDAYAQRQRERD